MNDTPTTLLVAERDESTRAFLVDNLAADGYEPVGAQTEEETRLKLRNHGPALLLLGGLGEDRRTLPLVGAIRSGEAGGDPTLPVIVLGERDEELELLRAFEAGCDDFVANALTSVFGPLSSGVRRISGQLDSVPSGAGVTASGRTCGSM